MRRVLIDSAIKATVSASRRHRHLIDEGVREIGFQRTAHMTLMHLAKMGCIFSQKELAEKFSLSPAAVTGILKKLERDGYIMRSPGKDCRFNEIAITPLGREVVERSCVVFQEVDTAMFDGMSEDEIMLYLRLMERADMNLKRKSEGLI